MVKIFSLPFPICCFLLFSRVAAGTIMVGSPADDTDADGTLTLREAILISEGKLGRALTLIETTLTVGQTGQGQADEIQIPAAVATVQLERPLPTIQDANTWISGFGMSGIVIDGGGSSHIFRVEHCSFKLENVTLKNFTNNAVELDCENQPPAGGQISTSFRFVTCQGGMNGLKLMLAGKDGIQLQVLKASFKDLSGNGVVITSSVGGTYDFQENRFEAIAKTGFLGTFGNGQGNISVVYRANAHEKNPGKDSIGAIFETLDHSAELKISFRDNRYLANNIGVSMVLAAGTQWSSENNLLESNAEVGMLLRTKAGESAVEIDLKGELFLNNKTGLMVEAEGKIRFLSQLTETLGGQQGWVWFFGVGAEGRWDDDGSRFSGTAEVGIRLLGKEGSAIDIFLEHSQLDDNRTGLVGFRLPFSVFLDDARVTHNGTGLLLIDSHAKVQNSLICTNHIDGVQVHGESDVLISGSILDQNGVYNVRNLSARPVLASQNDWGSETTAEMEVGGFPSDIRGIFDQFDSAASGPVEYGGWITPAVGCSEAIPADPSRDFHFLSDGSVSTAPPSWLDIRSAGLTANNDGFLAMEVVSSEAIPDLPGQLASVSVLLDADGELETGVNEGTRPFSAFPELGVDVLARVNIRPDGRLEPILFVGGEAIERGMETPGLVEAATFESSLLLTIPLDPLEGILSDLRNQPVLIQPTAWKWTAFTSYCPLDGTAARFRSRLPVPSSVVECPDQLIDVFPNSAFKPAQAVLRFPFFRESQSSFSGYAFSNDTDRNAFLRIRAYQEDGRLLDAPVNPIRFGLPIQSQSARLGREYLFEEQPISTSLAAWMEVFSDHEGVAGFFLTGDNTLQRQDGATAIPEPARHLYFSQVLEGVGVFQGQDAVTHLALANPGNSAVLLELRFTSAATLGAPLASQGPDTEVTTREIAAKGFLYQTLEDLFETQRARHGFLEVVVLEGEGVVGFALTEFPQANSIIGQNAQIQSADRTLYSAQLAASGQVFSNLSLVNTTAESRFVFLSAIAGNGQLIADDVSLLMAPGSAFSADVSLLFDFSNPPIPANVPAPVVGSLEVRADGEGIIANVLFGAPQSLDFAATLPLAGLEDTGFVFSHVANALGLFTGLAFLNPSQQEPVSIYVEVFSREGLLQGSEVVRLGPRERISKLLSEIVPASAGQAGGYVRVNASRRIVAQQLFGSNQLNMLSAVASNR